MNFNPVIIAIPIYFLLIGIELVVQWVTSKKLYRLNDAITNISCGITQQLTGIFLKVLGIGAYTIVFEHLAISQIPSTWWSYFILFIGADFFYYWAHRMSHEINLFWGGHVVHHQSEDYNFSVALRQGSFQIIWTFAFYMPLAIAGFHPLDFVFVSALVTVYQFWIHTETLGKLGWFELIFNTPSHHRVHHGRDPKYIDKNHAGVFIIWDKMFGTFQEEEEKPTYGITKPINSWNPVWVNINHYYEMFSQWRRIKGFKNKMNYLFNKPGWLPEEMGGYQPAPQIKKESYQKYDTKTKAAVNWYVLFQYLVSLGATAYFLFNYTRFESWLQIGIVCAILSMVVNAGGLLDNRKWAIWSEWLRLMIFLFITVLFFSKLVMWMIFVIAAYAMISIVIFFFASKKATYA